MSEQLLWVPGFWSMSNYNSQFASSKSRESRGCWAKEPESLALPMNLWDDFSHSSVWDDFSPVIPQVHSPPCPLQLGAVQSLERFLSAHGTSSWSGSTGCSHSEALWLLGWHQAHDTASTSESWAALESPKSRAACRGQCFVIWAICNFASLGLCPLIRLCSLCPSFLLS